MQFSLKKAPHGYRPRYPWVIQTVAYSKQEATVSNLLSITNYFGTQEIAKNYV